MVKKTDGPAGQAGEGVPAGKTTEPKPNPKPNPEDKPIVDTAPAEDSPESVFASKLPEHLRTALTPVLMDRSGLAGFYHVGVRSGCPVQQPTLGGVTFPRMTDPPIRNKPTGLSVDRNRRAGDYVWMEAEKVVEVAKAIGRRIVRWKGSVGELRLTHDVAGKPKPRYRPKKDDQPLGNFVYIKPAQAGDDLPMEKSGPVFADIGKK